MRLSRASVSDLAFATTGLGCCQDRMVAGPVQLEDCLALQVPAHQIAMALQILAQMTRWT
ncbi:MULTISPECIES: hypothetical protein [Brucella/Ochrobactrum group]|uniref:hypothetical protein n=1 Tax=Brucella/Ochrobactrum group TaxID=2826938 RepID=UPI00178C347C|nr:MULTISPECIES: hypothetical protein [Brucella/Ochrobactrum group]MCQ9147576.1 hypothetical protein [Ochrobactrum sp. BTU2]UGQ24514.1 hypothetical protein LRL11_23475 [Brucella anthropi]